MKKLILFSVFLLPFLSVGQDCTDFHIGTYHLKVDGKTVPDYKLVFKKRKQIEYVGDHFTKSKMILNPSPMIRI